MEAWKTELLRRGYRGTPNRPIDFSIAWPERKWFSIDGGGTILQIWFGQVYTRIVCSEYGTPEQPYAYDCRMSVLHPEYPKTDWYCERREPAFLSAEEIWKCL